MKPILAAMLSVGSLHLSDEEKQILSAANPLGITLFKRNIESFEQVRALTQEIREVIGRENVLIATDEEGGRVCRFASPFGQDFVAQRAIGALPLPQAQELTALHGQLIAAVLRNVGVVLNYAPCLDVAYPQTDKVLKSRCFSDDEKKVALLGETLVKTYLQNGIIPCVKHLPGHGRASVDPHLNLPIIDVPLDCLQKDIYPFAAVADLAPMGMTAHILVPALDADWPITQSAKGINFIRQEVGFEGFLLSDAIEMRALAGSLSEKTRLSLQAGCDAVCYCQGKAEGLREVVGAASFLDDKGLERLYKMETVLKNNMALSTTAIEDYKRLAAQTPLLCDDYDAVEVLNRLQAYS